MAKDPQKERRKEEENFLNGRKDLIANNIHQLRKDNKISLHKLQEGSGYAATSFLRYEKGTVKHIHREALEKIAYAFTQSGVHCTVDDLIKDDFKTTITASNLELTPYERKTLMWFNKLNAIGQARAIEYLKDIAKVPEYQDRSGNAHKLNGGLQWNSGLVNRR